MRGLLNSPAPIITEGHTWTANGQDYFKKRVFSWVAINIDLAILLLLNTEAEIHLNIIRQDAFVMYQI